MYSGIGLHLLFFTAVPAALLFAIQLIPWVLSSRFRAFVRNRPILRRAQFFWGLYSLIGGMVCLPVLLAWWPPPSIERPRQEAEIKERIQAVGGWSALQKDCDALAENLPKNQDFSWFMADEDTLPRSISSLKPLEVRFYPPQILSDDEPQIPITHIRVFGRHRTGGHSEPYLGIDVISGKDSTGYPPKPNPKDPGSWSHPTYKKVTDTIYEVYYE